MNYLSVYKSKQAFFVVCYLGHFIIIHCVLAIKTLLKFLLFLIFILM